MLLADRPGDQPRVGEIAAARGGIEPSATMSTTSVLEVDVELDIEASHEIEGRCGSSR